MSNDTVYDIDALKQGLVKCDNNIQIFEDAIERENSTKRNYREMIAVLEEKALRNDNKNGRIN